MPLKRTGLEPPSAPAYMATVNGSAFHATLLGSPPSYDNSLPSSGLLDENRVTPLQSVGDEITTSKAYSGYSSHQSLCIGVILAVGGIICFVCSSISLRLAIHTGYSVFEEIYTGYGSGLWSFILFLTTGLAGVATSRKKTKCQIIMFLVLCIIGIADSVNQVRFGVLGAINTSSFAADYYKYYGINNSGLYNTFIMIMVLGSMQAVVGVVVGLTSLWGVVICCKVAPCCDTQPAYLSHHIQDHEQGLIAFEYNQLHDDKLLDNHHNMYKIPGAIIHGGVVYLAESNETATTKKC